MERELEGLSDEELRIYAWEHYRVKFSPRWTRTVMLRKLEVLIERGDWPIALSPGGRVARALGWDKPRED